MPALISPTNVASTRIRSGIYDVAVDGGATGFYPTPLVLGQNTQILFFWYKVITAFTTSVNITWGTGNVVNSIIELKATDAGNYTIAGYISYPVFPNTAIVDQTGTNPGAVTFSINSGPLLTGKLVYYVQIIDTAN